MADFSPKLDVLKANAESWQSATAAMTCAFSGSAERGICLVLRSFSRSAISLPFELFVNHKNVGTA